MKRPIIVLLIVGLAVVLQAQPAISAAILVDGGGGSDSNDGSSWALAKLTIAAAITAAVSGDEIWVRGKDGTGSFSGVYLERITLKEGVALYGGLAYGDSTLPSRGEHPPFSADQWPNDTVIDGSASGNVVTIPTGATSATVIDGFTIRNGSYGVYCPDGSPLIMHNRIESNTTYGVYGSNGSPVVQYNLIRDNAGGVSCGTYCTATVSKNIIRGNGSNGVSSQASVTLDGNFISGNNAGITATSGSPVVSNNSIAGNVTGLIWVGSPTISCNIVAFNTKGMDQFFSFAVNLQYNCVYGNSTYDYSTFVTSHSTDINVDPKLGGLAYGELHIQADSPCWQAGVNTNYTDIDGETITGGACNIGADAVFPATPPIYDGLPPVTVMVDGAYGDDDNDGVSWTEAKQTIQAAVDLASPWGGAVWAKEGTYDEHVSIASYAYLYGGFSGSETLLGQRDWLGNETIISPSTNGSVVSLSRGYLTNCVDGFTITNGTATNGGGIYCSASAVIANNRVTGNSAAYGGGVYCSNSTVLESNLIDTNTASSAGGGVYCIGSVSSLSPTVSRNVIANNTCTGSGSSCGGGGIRITSGSVPISNNVLVGNSADYGSALHASYWLPQPMSFVNNTVSNNLGGDHGTVYLSNRTGTIANNIIASNAGYGIYATGTYFPTLYNNDVYGNPSGNYYGISAGTGDISSDPAFLDSQNGNYHLAADSPCIDVGDDTKVTSGWLDIDGEPRQVDVPDEGTANTKVDMGADEYYLDYAHEPLVDEGLPTQNINGSGQARTNFRWANPSPIGACGDTFSFASWPGPAWRVDKIIVWVVPDVPVWPLYALGDHFSSITLYGGSIGGSFDDIVTGTLQTGSNAISAPTGTSIVAEADHYGVEPNTYDYEAADGQRNKIWKITFDVSSLNWTVADGAQGVFGVYGAPRYDRLWFSHAAVTSDASADILLFNAVSPSLTTWVDPKEWFGGKKTNINVKVFATPVVH